MTFNPQLLRWLLRALQFSLSMFFLFWIIGSLQTGPIAHSFASASPGPMVLALGVISFGWVIRAWRYDVLISTYPGLGENSVGLWLSLKGFAIFLAGNAALPLRGGEWLRIAYMKISHPSFSTAFLTGAAGAEKLPELAYAAIVLGVWMVFAQSGLIALVSTILIVYLSVLIAIALIGRALIGHLSLSSAGGSTEVEGARLINYFKRAASPLLAFADIRRTLSVGLATLVVRFLDSLIMLVVASALGIALTPEASILIGVTLSLGLIVSALPAHLGMFEASIIAGATLAGMSQEDGLTFGLAFHAVVLASWILAICFSAPQFFRMFNTRPDPQ